MPALSTINRRDPGGRLRTPSRRIVVQEYKPLTGLPKDEQRDLERFALEEGGDGRSVLTLRNGLLHAQNYVGIIETRRGTVIEILPKIDLSDSGADNTRKVFLTMLRDWRRLREAQRGNAGIRAIRRFDMFEAFVHLFLTNVVLLTQRGLARAYRTQEANLPCLRGRILFPAHIRENLVDRSRFYVGYDEFTANRPANRLIHLALRQLVGIVRHPANLQRLHQLRIVFSSVPLSTNLNDDWAGYRLDRSMRHYDAVMPWVRLFLFGHGLATFAGSHINRAMLFPMEEIFEDFVTAAVRRHQRRFTVHAQDQRQHLATNYDTRRPAFWLKPDIVLRESGQARFILDAKWKRLDSDKSNHGVGQADAYQLFAYGKKYGCRRVALVYPKTTGFSQTLRFRLDENPDLELACFPFDVANPAGTIETMMQDLLR